MLKKVHKCYKMTVTTTDLNPETVMYVNWVIP